MKFRLLMMSSLVLVASCTGRPLAEIECQTMTDKETEFAASRMPTQDRDSFKEWVSRDQDAYIAQCVAGKTYSRRDYKCAIRAEDMDALGKCIKAASDRINKNH